MTNPNQTMSSPHLASGGPFRWRAIDIITVAITGVAFGVAFWAWDVTLYPLVSALLAGFPPAGSLTLGVWVLPCVFAAFLVRRPGAALLCEFIAASVEMLLGNQWGGSVLISAVLQALGVEIMIAIFIWRTWSILVALLSAVLSATLELTCYEWWVYLAKYSFDWKLASYGFAAISCLIIAGLGGFALIKAMASTRALDAFPPGREWLAHSA